MAKSLQRLTPSELSKQDIITEEQFNQLSSKQQQQLQDIARDEYNEATGSGKDEILVKYECLFDKTARNKLYEHNHRNIIYAIHRAINESGWIPSTSDIAKATDLSRQTVTKHLKAFRDSDEYNEQQAKLETMRLSVLGLVYKMATQGNLKACKMFLDYSGTNTFTSVGTFIDKQQNNF